MEPNSTEQSEQRWYDKTWLVVLLCLFVFPVGLYALWKNSSIGKGWKIGLTIFIGLVVLAGISDDESSTTASDAEQTVEVAKAKDVSVPDEPVSTWDYTESKDAMSGQDRYFASCMSTNRVDFEFPYNGGSTFTLTVRNMGNGNEVVLQVSKGQFMTSFSSSQGLRAKFDDGQPLEYTYNSASDGSMDVIFLNDSRGFISNLKKSKKLMLEAQFFSQGNKIIYFDVAGLNWDK